MIKTYRKDEVAWFYSGTDPRWDLSNVAGKNRIWWPLEKVPENLWYSSEALYQAAKYTADVLVPEGQDYGGKRLRDVIQAQTSGLWAKWLQEWAEEAGLVRPDWERDGVRVQAMAWVLELKVFWNPERFGKVLRETGDMEIVEISSRDPFWGCLRKPGGLLVGENHLGRLLTDLRGKMEAVLAGEFTYPDGFLLPGERIAA